MNSSARGRILLTWSSAAAAVFAITPGIPAVPAAGPPDFAAFGVYLSWERVGANAKVSGIDKWEDASRRLDAVEACKVNLLWVTNMSEADLPRLIDECDSRGIRLLPSMSSIEAKVDWRWADDGRYYAKRVPQVVAIANGKKALVGWVLSDEPQIKHFPRVEKLRDRFREADPTRFCTVVTMWPQTPAAARELRLPVVCVDLYPFFGPKDPNGPHTDAASRSFMRRNATAMIEAIGSRPAVGWVMGMCFSDIWGPRRYNAQGHLIGLPGSYLHWRAPTLAEMRWQVWETFRTGAKGFVCYTLAPEAPNPKTATLEPPKVAWKNVLAREATDLGPNALTNPDGSATPQLMELGRLYGRLTPHAALLRRWQRRGEPFLEVDSPGKGRVFMDPVDQALYALVLNDDLRREQNVSVRVGEGIVAVRDLLTGTVMDLEKDFAGGSSTFKVPLAAGDGTILVLERQASDRP
ncbi:MAG: hypothetical protein GXP31_06225 [Kiritimatiellaeota bacterium]|nr:hypothetical protein [Kiritimatiellota bacterium]